MSVSKNFVENKIPQNSNDISAVRLIGQAQDLPLHFVLQFNIFDHTNPMFGVHRAVGEFCDQIKHLIAESADV